MHKLGAVIFSVGLLMTSACQERDTTERTPSADEQVVAAQRESEKALESARSAQEKAREEQEDIRKAEREVSEKQQELAEAEAKLERQRQQAEEAQAHASQQSTVAQQQAQSAQARATETQLQARREYEARRSGLSSSRASDQQVTETPFANEWFSHLMPTTLKDEGVLRSVSGDEVVLERDDGSKMTLKVDKWSATMPEANTRVRIQYRMDNGQPIAEQIEEY